MYLVGDGRTPRSLTLPACLTGTTVESGWISLLRYVAWTTAAAVPWREVVEHETGGLAFDAA